MKIDAQAAVKVTGYFRDPLLFFFFRLECTHILGWIFRNLHRFSAMLWDVSKLSKTLFVKFQNIFRNVSLGFLGDSWSFFMFPSDKIGNRCSHLGSFEILYDGSKFFRNSWPFDEDNQRLCSGCWSPFWRMKPYRLVWYLLARLRICLKSYIESLNNELIYNKRKQ